MSVVQKWLEEIEDKVQLVDLLLKSCHLTGKQVVDGGKGCSCLVHRAFRLAELELVDSSNKPLHEKLIQASKVLSLNLTEAEKQNKIKDDLLKQTKLKLDGLIQASDAGKLLQKDYLSQLAGFKQENNSLLSKVESQAAKIAELLQLQDKIKEALMLVSGK